MHSWDSKKVRIRKNHRCLGCGDLHHVGDTMYAHNGVGEEGYWYWHTCEICEAFMKTPKFDWGNYSEGGLIMYEPMFEKDQRDYDQFRYAFLNNLILA